MEVIRKVGEARLLQENIVLNSCEIPPFGITVCGGVIDFLCTTKEGATSVQSLCETRSNAERYDF